MNSDSDIKKTGIIKRVFAVRKCHFQKHKGLDNSVHVDYGLTSVHSKHLLGFSHSTNSPVESDLFNFVLLSVTRMGTVHRFSVRFPISILLTETAAEMTFFL